MVSSGLAFVVTGTRNDPVNPTPRVRHPIRRGLLPRELLESELGPLWVSIARYYGQRSTEGPCAPKKGQH